MKDINIPNYVAISIKKTPRNSRRRLVTTFAAVAWTNNDPVDELPSIFIKVSNQVVDGIDIENMLFDFRQWLRSMAVFSSKPVHLVGENLATEVLPFLTNKDCWPTSLISPRVFDTSMIAANGQGIEPVLEVYGEPSFKGEQGSTLYDAQLSMWHCQQFCKHRGFN
jgi:hypothetical protein